MIRNKRQPALKLTALAIAAAAAVAPIAWSVESEMVVNQSRNFAATADEPVLYDRFIVTYRDGSAGEAAAASRSANTLDAATDLNLGLQSVRTLSTGAEVIVSERPLDEVESKALMSEIIKNNPAVLAVEPDIRLQPQFVPNDPQYASQWHYKNGAGGANLEPAWDFARGDGVVVGVIDTGITTHSEFVGQTVPGYDFIGDVATANDGDGRDADPSDPGDWTTGQCGPSTFSSWHGTHVSGTIAALTNNGVGVAGVAPNAKILPLRALGRCGGFLSDIVDAITWGSGGAVTGLPANANPAEVLNLSLGGGGACSAAFQTAINNAVARGTTVVVAAGNSGGDAASQQPASCNNVISVAAVGPNGNKAGYSSFGPVVDVAAPGGSNLVFSENVLSTMNLGSTTPSATEGYAYRAGTSMASPHVAGIAALIQSVSATPRTPAQIKQIIENTAYANGGFPGGCNFAAPCGAGIVDATAAVNVARGAAPLPPNPPTPPPPPPATELFNGVTISNITVARNGTLRYELTVPNGASNLLFAMFGGTGDGDIYVRYGAEPTNTVFDCRPFRGGNDETCFFPNARAGKWYVQIRGFSNAAGVSLYTSFVDQNYPYKEAATVTQLDNHQTQVNLTWQHGKKEVEIYRNGQLYNSRRNKFAFTDRFRIVGTGTMTYKVCNLGTQECSSEVTVEYNSRP
jgi:serine protease